MTKYPATRNEMLRCLQALRLQCARMITLRDAEIDNERAYSKYAHSVATLEHAISAIELSLGVRRY